MMNILTKGLIIFAGLASAIIYFQHQTIENQIHEIAVHQANENQYQLIIKILDDENHRLKA